mgnify:CR=1 FL=1
MQKKEGAIKSIVVLPEFAFKDAIQVIIGASILSVPIGFTQETWDLAFSIPLINTLSLMFLSILFISMFSYYNYHKHVGEKHHHILVKRVASTYIFSFIVVAIILGLIQKTPWLTDFMLAFKRVVITTFPASMSAAIADTLK